MQAIPEVAGVDAWLTVRRVADFLDITPDRVRFYVREGYLDGRKFGNAWRISQSSLSEFLKKRGFFHEGESSAANVIATHTTAPDPAQPRGV